MLALPKFSTCPRPNNEGLINRVFNLDWLEMCQAIGECSVDAIITDLPYG